MPRKAKEKIEEIEEKNKKKSVVKKAESKAVPKKKTTTTKKSATVKKTTTVKKSASVKKTATRKSALAKIIESIDDEPVKEEKESKAKGTKKAASKKTAEAKTSTKNATAKKSDEAKVSTKKSAAKKTIDVKATAKKTTTKKSSETKAATKKAASEKKATTKATTTKKASATKTTSKKPAAKKSTTKKTKKSVQILEYYDLPYKYGNTVVKLLAQTPKTLFVYWEVSDADIENFKKTYGDDFFTKTRPVLIVHNLTLNKTSEVEINDFANCWYLNTDDTDCKFDIELARKFVDNSSNGSDNSSDYLYVAQSNDMQSPNNHILFEKIQEFVVFRNANNDNVVKKNIKSFKFLKDIYKFYKDMYDEDLLNNPSSQFKF